MKQWLLVGLGNPGGRYEKTRHNLGIRMLRFWIEQKDPMIQWKKSDRFEAEMADTGEVIAFFPLTGMNESGRAVAAYARASGIKPEQIILIHDEVELPFGEVRFKEGGSAAGHNGVRSVQAAVGSEALLRLRIGVGRPPFAEPGGATGGKPLALHDYVLQAFTPNEEAQVPAILMAATQTLEPRLSQE